MAVRGAQEAMAELGAQEAMAVQGAQEAMAVQGAQEAMAVQGAQEAMAVQGAQEAMAVRGAQEAMAVQGAQEAMAELGAQEAMAVQGAQEAMAVQGAQEAMAVQGAQEAMVVQGAQEAMAVQGAQEYMVGAGSSGGHGRLSLWPWPCPSAQPLQPEPFYPPQKIHGAALGVSEPSRAVLRNRGPFELGLEVEASSGHDEESGALTGSLSNRFHIHDRRGRRLGMASMDKTDKTSETVTLQRFDILTPSFVCAIVTSH